MGNLNKEREVLAQLYSNNADVIKYLPFFFNNIKEFELFLDTFGGKTIKLPENSEEYIKRYMKPDNYIKDDKRKGINNLPKIKKRIINSYFNLFMSLEDVIKNECENS